MLKKRDAVGNVWGDVYEWLTAQEYQHPKMETAKNEVLELIGNKVKKYADFNEVEQDNNN